MIGVAATVAEDLLIHFLDDAPVLMRATAGHKEKEKGRLFRRTIEWLLSPDHFHFKFLLGTAVGVLVIVLLAVTCVVLTFRGQRQATLRAHSIEVTRLTSVIENDIAALENAHRGYLLTQERAYLENFTRRKTIFQKHSETIAALLSHNSAERKGVLKLRGIVWNWIDLKLPAMTSRPSALDFETSQTKDALGGAQLDEARNILHSIQREEQILLTQRAREQQWAAQSTEVLDFIPRIQRAAYEMQKEKRGYLLTGDPAFIDFYKRASTDFYTFHGHLLVLVTSSPPEFQQLEQIRISLERWISQSAEPDIELKRAGRDLSPRRTALDERLMNDVRGQMDRFEQEQLELYQARSAAAAQERLLTMTSIDIICALVAALMIASSTYSFVISRRQLRRLEQAEARMRLVIDNILDGMITVDENGGIFSMNPAAKRMFGYSGDEFVGQPFTRLVPKCFDREVEGAPAECQWAELASRTGGTTCAVAQAPGRPPFSVEISLSEMIVEKRKFYVAMVRDVTERKRMDEELAAEKKSLAVTLGSIGDGVITTDVHGRIVIFNPASAAMTGWASNEAVGQPLKAVFHIAADGPGQYRGQQHGYRSEAQAILLSTPERARLTSRDGTERVIEQHASPIRDAKNDLCGVVLVFRDITQRQRDEAERRKAETLEQLGVLAGGIAHDFNNLLTAIIGNVSLASLLLPPNDELLDRLNDAKNASLRARDLAQQLLTFARGGAPIKKSASIAKLIEETVSFSLRGSHNRSQLEMEPELWPAEFDPGQISQVIANLVVNADQAMPDGGTLHVSCENFAYTFDTEPQVPELPVGDYIRIKVRDEGVGIPQSCLKQIFDPYFTTKPKGSGLGLATTYSVVKNHHGLITVESELHCGSTFTIYLPAAPHEALAEPVTPSAELVSGSGRILIVDDEEAIRALVEFTLTRLGYEVTGAENALEGVALYRQALERGKRFDLVILDLTLPGGMGGKEALKKLLEIDPTVTAIVSSGYAMDATMSRYQDFGFRGVISKPYEASELGRTVHEVIQLSRLDYAPAPAYELQHAG